MRKLCVVVVLLVGCGQSENPVQQPVQLVPSGPKVTASATRDSGLAPEPKAPILPPAGTEVVRGLIPYNEYLDHGELAADLKLKGKVVEWKASFFTTSSQDGRYHVHFVAADGGADVWADVRGTIRPDQVPVFAKLKRFERVLVQGTCVGKRPLRPSWQGWGVFFEDVAVLKVLPQ